jgi:hypothetical protein
MRVVAASDNYFRALGTRLALGRPLAPSDGAAGAEPVAVIGHALWTERFQGRADALGRVIRINRQPFTVVGVAPPAFYGAGLSEATLPAAERSQLWIPLSHAAAVGFPARGADEPYLQLAGRLADGASRRAANAEAGRMAAVLEAAGTPRRRVATLRATPLGEGPGESSLLNALLVMSVPLIVLTIACGNLGVLLLAQATSRAQELAVRTAVGATHGRILRQFFAESVLVAVLAGALGLLLSLWAVDLARVFALDLPVRPGLNPSVLLFTLGLVAATTLVFGLVPAHRLARGCSRRWWWGRSPSPPRSSSPAPSSSAARGRGRTSGSASTGTICWSSRSTRPRRRWTRRPRGPCGATRWNACAPFPGSRRWARRTSGRWHRSRKSASRSTAGHAGAPGG